MMDVKQAACASSMTSRRPPQTDSDNEVAIIARPLHINPAAACTQMREHAREIYSYD